jgi:hypothetical protein
VRLVPSLPLTEELRRTKVYLEGNPTADLNIRPSGLPRPPPSTVINRLYFEGGAEVVSGIHIAIDVKEKPEDLWKMKDYPSLSNWLSLQPVIFYDTSSSRAWLIDGVSALLHLVRTSLHADANDPESAYEWVFNSNQLQEEDWSGHGGRPAAMNTLKNWNNLNQILYVVSKRIVSGQIIVEYSTLEMRVMKILHSLEILIDRQVRMASQDCITMPQALPSLRSSIVGFDTLDILHPLGPILPRIHQGRTMPGYGWRDIDPDIGITTIFGDGFGDLIRPKAGSDVCELWKTVPSGADYLYASLSTLKMLHETRLTRLWPGLGHGEVTEKIVWLGPSHPFARCQCSSAPSCQSGPTCQVNPVQYLMSKRLRSLRSIPRSMPLVDLTKIKAQGAVVFGHMFLLNPSGDNEDDKLGHKSPARSKQKQVRGHLSAVSSTRGSSTSSQRRNSTSAGASVLSSGTSQPSMTTIPDGSTTRSNSNRASRDAGHSRVTTNQRRPSKRDQWWDKARRLLGLV